MSIDVFAEYLSDGIPFPKIGFPSDNLFTRYGASLWQYDTEKAKAGYISENDNLTWPRSHFKRPTQEDLINVD